MNDVPEVSVAHFEEPVEVVPYDPVWPALFAQEAMAIRRVFGDRVIAFEHFGSTAVPGLAAKPIVDLLIGVEHLVAEPEEIAGMARLGYELLGTGAVPGRIHFRKRGEHSFNANLMIYGGELWRDNLLIRDFLRRHADEAERYAAFKRAIAAAHPASLIRYAEAKAPFMAVLLERARSEAP